MNQVQADSPAERAGIRHGDVITRINEIEIESAPQLRLVVSQMLPGREVKVVLFRGGERLELPVVLGSLDGSIAQAGPQVRQVMDGVSIAPLTDVLRKEFTIPDEIEGLVVTDLSIESPYANVFVKGLVIIEVNGKPMQSLDDLEAAIGVGANSFYSWFGGMKRYIGIRIKAE